jgi:hypothetical protein
MLFDKYSEPMVQPVIKATKESLGGSGILTDADLEQLSAACLRVYELMKDGQWHSPSAIEAAAGSDGVPAREGLRRMRQLKQVPGLSIEKKRMGDGRLWYYRLVTQ